MRGVCSAGLMTIVFPQHKAGASFHTSMSKGKFHCNGAHRPLGGPGPACCPVPDAQRGLGGGPLLCMVQIGGIRGNIGVCKDQNCISAWCLLSAFWGMLRVICKEDSAVRTLFQVCL